MALNTGSFINSLYNEIETLTGFVRNQSQRPGIRVPYDSVAGQDDVSFSIGLGETDPNGLATQTVLGVLSYWRRWRTDVNIFVDVRSVRSGAFSDDDSLNFQTLETNAEVAYGLLADHLTYFNFGPVSNIFLPYFSGHNATVELTFFSGSKIDLHPNIFSATFTQKLHIFWRELVPVVNGVVPFVNTFSVPT